MKEQFASARGVVVGLALSNGLDLSAAQTDAGLEFFQEEVVVAGDAIVSGIALTRGYGVAGPGRLLGAGGGGLNNHVAGLASHPEASSNLNRSIGNGFRRFCAGLC